MLWLSWGFFAWLVEGKFVLALPVLLLSAFFIRWRCRQKRLAQQLDDASHFPPKSHNGPVVLVCGEVNDAMFAGGSCRGTAQGFVHKAAEEESRAILALHVAGTSVSCTGQSSCLVVWVGYCSVWNLSI